MGLWARVHSPHLFVSWLSQRRQACTASHTDNESSFGCRFIDLIGLKINHSLVPVSTRLRQAHLFKLQIHVEFDPPGGGFTLSPVPRTSFLLSLLCTTTLALHCPIRVRSRFGGSSPWFGYLRKAVGATLRRKSPQDRRISKERC